MMVLNRVFLCYLTFFFWVQNNCEWIVFQVLEEKFFCLCYDRNFYFVFSVLKLPSDQWHHDI